MLDPLVVFQLENSKNAVNDCCAKCATKQR